MKRMVFLIITMQISLYAYNQCIDYSKICNTCFCPMVYDPVCGCDGKIYENSCEALIHGVVSWKSSSDIIIVSPSEVCKGNVANISATGGSAYVWNTGEHTYNISKTPQSTTTYLVTVSFPSGCQLTKSTTVKVNNVYTTVIDSLISLGDSIKIGNNYYTLPGSFSKKLFSIKGCDSIVNLTVRLKGFDTCLYHIYDTIRINRFDTIHINKFDTIRINRSDTIHHYDTIRIINIDTLHVTLVDLSNQVGLHENGSIVMNIYPNPTNKHLFIDVPNEIIETCELYDLNGLLVKQFVINKDINYIELADLSKGTYVLIVNTKNHKKINRKVIIQ